MTSNGTVGSVPNIIIHSRCSGDALVYAKICHLNSSLFDLLAQSVWCAEMHFNYISFVVQFTGNTILSEFEKQLSVFCYSVAICTFLENKNDLQTAYLDLNVIPTHIRIAKSIL